MRYTIFDTFRSEAPTPIADQLDDANMSFDGGDIERWVESHLTEPNVTEPRRYKSFQRNLIAHTSRSLDL